MHYVIGLGLLVTALATFVAGLWFLAVPAAIAGVVVLVRNPGTPSYGYSHFVAENPGAEASPSDADQSSDNNDCDDSDAGDSDGGSCDSDSGGSDSSGD